VAKYTPCQTVAVTLRGRSARRSPELTSSQYIDIEQDRTLSKLANWTRWTPVKFIYRI